MLKGKIVRVESGRTKAASCPNCGQILDAATVICDPSIRPSPEPGDMTLCAYCHSMAVFDAELNLRELTDEEWLVFNTDPNYDDVRKILEMFKEVQNKGTS